MHEEASNTYRAFISYSHTDSRTVAWLHRSLETYRLPKRLVGQMTSRGEAIPARLKPIFRDRDELGSAPQLSSAIREALARSDALIVVCSREAAVSRWVNQEVVEFQRLGRAHRIYCVIVDGTPGSADFDECFPPALRGDEVEPLAADLRPRGDGRKGTRLKLVASLVGIGLDDLVVRDQRRRLRRMVSVTCSAVVSTVFMTLLAVSAYLSQQEAEWSRNQAEDLIGFMLGELRQKLEPVGRLDVLDSVTSRAMDYFSAVGKDQMSNDMLMKRSVALRQIGEVRMFRGKGKESLEAFDESLVLARRLADREPMDTGIHFDLGQIQYWTGYLYWQKKDYQRAEELFTDYLNTAKCLIEIDGPDPRWRTERAYAYLNLGGLFSRQKLHGKARENFELAIAQLEALSTEFPDNAEYRTELANCYSWLGSELLEFGELTGAIDVFERSIRVLDSMRTGDQNKILAAKIAGTAHHLAGLYLSSADFDNAADIIDRGRKLYSELTELDPSNIVWQRSHALSYLLEARLHHARDNLTAAIESIERASGIIKDVDERTDIESHREKVATVSNDHARILLASNRIDAAESTVQNAIRLLQGDSSYELARAHLTMGLIHHRKGDPLRAAEAWGQAKRIILKLRGSSARLKDTALLAELSFYAGEYEMANALVSDLHKSGYRNIVIERLSP